MCVMDDLATTTNHHRHYHCHHPYPRYQAMRRNSRRFLDQTIPCGRTFDECQSNSS